jgi:hypothetical protein
MKAREYTSRQPHHTKYKIKEIQGENLFRLKLELICNLYSGIIKGQCLSLAAAAGQWFFLGTSVSSSNKTDRHNIH